MPDAAAKHLGGYGVVLVGLDGQAPAGAERVVGAERVDGAVLHDALQPYLGDDGPKWDYMFIDHPTGLVMAVIVDPPQWGDRIHACRKEYSDVDGNLTVRDGDVFIRVPGKTRPATSHDLANLERRRDRSPSRGAEISVEYEEKFDRVDSASVIDLLSIDIEQKAKELLKPLSTRSQNALPYSFQLDAMLGRQDERTPDQFRQAVEEWRDEALAGCRSVATEFFRHELARGKLAIRNESEQYLVAVRMQVHFPPGVLVLMASDTEYCDHGGGFKPFTLLPDPPAKWGSLSPYDFGRFAAANFGRLTAATPVAIPIGFDIEESDAGMILTWDVGDLRPKSREVAGELLAVVTDDHTDTIVAQWRVTARGVNHVFEGEVRLECAQQHGEHLTWSRPGRDND
ncbi:hypothetical protein Kfla_5569 [Kribbella flavida DSM 17836]|uniref:Schlafen AlbA-2 domain-containing protein n=2 Tax=Kribbella flavida TaxID=182640 RepID=D2PN91_KRIFD|nr:hypothetical protein Kfla_5569 [Kribbella flavida DSM 17836]